MSEIIQLVKEIEVKTNRKQFLLNQLESYDIQRDNPQERQDNPQLLQE